MSAVAETPTRDAVLASAIAAFARTGYAGTSVNDILSATGLSKPTLYYHFGSKEGLYSAILESAFDGSAQQAQARIDEAKSSTERLVGMTVGLFEFARSHQDLMRLVFAAAFAAPGEIPSQALQPKQRRRILDIARKLIQAGQDAGEFTRDFTSDEMAQAYLGTVSQQIRMWLLQQDGDLKPARARRLVDFFLHGAGI